MRDDLFEAARDAIETLRGGGHGVDALFGERSVQPEQLAPASAYAIGVIEGAGIALGLTAIELLDELGLLPPRA
jgi:hypothetical protein